MLKPGIILRILKLGNDLANYRLLEYTVSKNQTQLLVNKLDIHYAHI